MIIGILMTMIEHFGPVYGQPGKQHEPRLQGHVLQKILDMANIWLKANDFIMFGKVPLSLSSLYGRIKE